MSRIEFVPHPASLLPAGEVIEGEILSERALELSPEDQRLAEAIGRGIGIAVVYVAAGSIWSGRCLRWTAPHVWWACRRIGWPVLRASAHLAIWAPLCALRSLAPSVQRSLRWA